jgi:cobalt/nickel transport system permease protein
MTLAYDALDPADSPIARLDARWRLAALVLAGAAASFLRSPQALGFACSSALFLLVVARLPSRLIVGRFAALALFLVPFLIVLPIVRGADGFVAAALVAVRAVTLFALALVVMATAPFHQTMRAAQALGVPRALTQITLMAYRYVFVLRDEFLRIRAALRVRGFRAGTSLHTYRTFAHVSGTLLIRGDERAERVAQAMRCRGFDGRFRSLDVFRTRPIDVALFAVVIIIAASLVAADRLLWS